MDNSPYIVPDPWCIKTQGALNGVGYCANSNAHIGQKVDYYLVCKTRTGTYDQVSGVVQQVFFFHGGALDLLRHTW